MSFSKSVNLEHAQRAVPCNICEDEVPGEYYCIECKQTLCPQCEKNHRRVAGTKNHNIVLRAQVGDIDTCTMTLTCADHREPASCHCEKCNISVCIKCVTGKHKGHTMSDLAEILEKEKKMLHDDIKAIQSVLPKLKSQKEEIISKRDNYKKEIQKILKEMEAEEQAAIKRIQSIHKKRVTDINSIQDSHLSIFDGAVNEINTKIISHETRKSKYEDTMAMNNLSTIRNVRKGNEPLPEIGRIPKIPEPPTFESGRIQLVVENLGKLNISYLPMSKTFKMIAPTIVSKFQCALEGYPAICITKDGDVWLGGRGSRELVMVDIKGQVLRSRKIQNRPYSLAVMDCGDVIISPHSKDSSSVSRLLGDGKEQHVYGTSPSHSVGVSVTADQEILICTLDGRVVRSIGGGTNVKEIYKGSGVGSALHAVEKSDGNIYISDDKNPAVVMISRDGKVLSTFTKTKGNKKLKWPLGLVVDKMDNILCADKDNHCVYIMYIIDQDQQMRELVGPSHGIQDPLWLAVDNDDNLWITQGNGTVHVVKYLSP